MPTFRPRAAAATICAAVLAMGTLGSASAASTPALPSSSNPHGTEPTIVLVHGAWADASSWSREITQLEHDGYPVLAPPNPLRSLSGDSEYLREFLSTVQARSSSSGTPTAAP